MGHLTRDPQTKNLPSGGAVTEFGIACNRKFKGQNGEDREEVTFVDCAAFAKTAELIQQYFTKGKPIFVQGRLKYDSWDDKQGGGKRHKLSVVVDTFQFIGDRDGGGAPATPTPARVDPATAVSSAGGRASSPSRRRSVLPRALRSSRSGTRSSSRIRTCPFEGGDREQYVENAPPEAGEAGARRRRINGVAKGTR